MMGIGGVALTGVPTLGQFIGSGSAASSSLLNSINSEIKNSNYFGGATDFLKQGREFFVNNLIRPIQEAGQLIKSFVINLDREEQYIPVTSEDMLPNIPTCMHDSIMRYAPIRKLYEEGRIFGFGWDYVPEEDVYGRLINNGNVDDVLAVCDENGEFEYEHTFVSTDPDLSFEELDAIEETRNYLDYILENTKIDPTDPLGNSRG